MVSVVTALNSFIKQNLRYKILPMWQSYSQNITHLTSFWSVHIKNTSSAPQLLLGSWLECLWCLLQVVAPLMLLAPLRSSLNKLLLHTALLSVVSDVLYHNFISFSYLLSSLYFQHCLTVHHICLMWCLHAHRADLDLFSLVYALNIPLVVLGCGFGIYSASGLHCNGSVEGQACHILPL